MALAELEKTGLEEEKEPEKPALPQEVQEGLAPLLQPGESVQAFVECDLLPSGEFGAAWLFATGSRLGLYHQNGAGAELLRDLPLESLEKLDRRDVHGAVLLEAVTPEETILVGRLTPAKMDQLSQSLPEVRKLLPGAEPEEEHHHWRRKEGDKKVCSKCGNPIPPWSGICVDCLQKRKLIFRLLSRVVRYWPIILVGLVTMVAVQGADLAQPWLQAQLIDHAIKGRDLPLLWKIVACLIGLSIVSQAVGAFRAYLMAWFGQKAIFDLRAELYAHIQKLSIAFYDSKQTGWIMDRLTSDTMNLQDFLTDALQDFVRDTVTLICILVILLSWNWKLALLSLLPTPFIGYASHIFMKKSHRLWHRVWRKRSKIATLLSDVVPGVRVVKAFGAESRETERFTARNRDFMQAAVGASRTFAFFGPVTGVLATIGFTMVWAYGGYQAITTPGAVSIGALIAFIQYLYRFYQPVQSLSRMAQRFQQSATAAQRVFEVLDTPADVRDEEGAKVMPQIVGRVEFENVTFGYEPHQEVLKGVSFTAEPGQMIGLVGPSGAGKSTTINLICRFYDVLEGAVRIDGIDIRDVTLESLRAQIGVVLQEPFLFHGTVFENIGYGRPDATPREIMEAAKAANCHDFVLRFPDGYDTVVGERGTRLSGGERQRLSIARAILKNPRILILDEATSSVDTETEGQIRQALDRLVQGRTTIAIAHRFSTLRHADRLLVMDKGKVAEFGTHAELLAMEDGLFRKLSDQQMNLAQIIAVGG